MKTDWQDYLYSSLALILSLLAALTGGYSITLFVSNTQINAFMAVLCLLTGLLVFGLTCAAQARVLLKFHPFIPGSYGMSDSVFMYWKLYSVLYYFGCGALKPFTVIFLKPLVQIMFGANIGKDIALGGTLVDPHLIRIGTEAIIGEGSILAAHAIIPGKILFGHICIEDRATVGVNAVVMPGVTIHKGAILLAGSVAIINTVIPENEIWGGTPAQLVKKPIH